MTSQIDIINRALLQIGARTTISALPPADNSVEAQAAAVLYQPTYESLARAAQWGCLRRTIVLSLLSAAQGTPENPNGTGPLPADPNWLYEYSYPADCLDFMWVIPNWPTTTSSNVPPTTINNAAATWLPSGGQIPYAVGLDTDDDGNFIRVIWTNQEMAQGVYVTNQPNPVIWDSLFQQAMVASLAAYLVPALSLSLPLMQLAIQVAERTIAQARTRDANEGVTVMDHVPDWIAARAGAQGFYGAWTGYYTGQYFDMNWPGETF